MSFGNKGWLHIRQERSAMALARGIARGVFALLIGIVLALVPPASILRGPHGPESAGLCASRAYAGELQAASTKASKAVKLNKSKATARAGTTVSLSVKNAKDAKVKWSSSNKKVATVDKNGHVLTKRMGKATITAKVKGKKLKCVINVNKKVVIPEKKAATLAFKFTKDGNTELVKSNPKMDIKVSCTHWWSVDIGVSSSNPTVADAKWNNYRKQKDTSTMVYGITVTAYRPGTATITLKNTFNNEKTQIKVTVKPAVNLVVDPANSLMVHYAMDGNYNLVTEYFLPIDITNKTGSTVQISSGAGLYSTSGNVGDMSGVYLFDGLTDMSDANDSTALGMYSVLNHLISSDNNSVYIPNGKKKRVYAYVGTSRISVTTSLVVMVGIIDGGNEYLCSGDYWGTVRFRNRMVS